MLKPESKPVVYQQAQSIWKEITTDKRMKDVESDLLINKKLLQFFQVGDFYYYLFNLRKMDFDYISPEMSTLLGYTNEQFTIPFLLEIIHPDDIAYFLAFEKEVVKFFNPLPKEIGLKYKVRYDYRIRKTNGEYIRILHQMIAIIPDDEGMTIQSLCVHTDITYLKPEGRPILSFIGMEGLPSYVDVAKQPELLPYHEPLTIREKQIVRLLIEGRTSKYIAATLFISVDTVKTHRKNILRKTKFSGTTELISSAIRDGWI